MPDAQVVGAYNPDLSQQAWEHSKKPWNASPQGRFAIRLVTRGVMGAAFFTVGGSVAGKWLKNYDTEASLLKQDNPLSFISKLIDIVVGKPVEVTVRTVGKVIGHEAPEVLGKRAVTFRPTNNFTTAKSMPSGRSLGHETSLVTFDFFCASIGDAWGRDIAGWIDPNAKKDWMKDGHIEWPKAIKQALKSTWRYVTYNGGEDWGVAIPYVYFMKGQRQLLNHFSPGFKMDFDRNFNGGSARASGNEIIGNYNRVGILDLQSRFVVYNMGTVAYRELYNHIGDTLKGKKSVLYGAADKPEVHGIGAKAVNVVKWMARSVIKGGIYMTPAVPFFWITRTPQSKHRAAIIDPEKGVMVYPGKDGASHLVTPDYAENPANYIDGKLKPIEGVHYAMPNEVTRKLEKGISAIAPMDYITRPHGKSFGTVDAVVNTAGRVSTKARRELLEQATKLNDAGGGVVGKKIKDWVGQDLRSLSNTYSNAAISYMPYMYAKAEFANLWDDGKMDMSIERAIDGATKLNFGEFKAGLREIGYSILHKPLPDIKREMEAQRRIELDDSAADVFIETKGQMQKDDVHAGLDDTKLKQAKLKWSERIVQGRAEDKPEVGANKPTTYAEQEEMRKALEQMHPPTNSIN